MEEFRAGIGYDVHRFAEGRKLFLGGIEITHSKGLLGHSDADVLIHAIIDALLGAAALGDIGTHFPDTKEEWKDADSKDLLAEVLRLVTEAGFRIVNVDSTLVAESPKLKDHIHPMRMSIATILNSDLQRISIKATTSEKMGFAGREEGMACYATCMLATTSD